MPTFRESSLVSAAERQKLLTAFPCFATFPPSQSAELAQKLQEVLFKSGAKVVQQEELVDAIYIIVSGRAEVTFEVPYKHKVIKTPVAVLGPEEGIGLNDTGFFSTTGKRTATVTALDELVLLKLTLSDLYLFLNREGLETQMQQSAEKMLRMRLIKQSLPFSKLSHERLEWLSAQVEHLAVAAGTVIFSQGETGDKCYLIRSGKIEISSVEQDGSHHQLAILKTPTLFGEATLISQEPRNAEAKALEDSRLLVLSYQHLNELWEKEQNVADMFMTLMVDRSRPSRNPDVAEYPRTTPDGNSVIILKNKLTSSYFKLSQEGWFIWQQMSGKQTLFEITMALADQYQIFSPSMVTALISKLARAGFVSNVNTDALVGTNASWLGKWFGRAKFLLEFRWIFKKADYWITKTYNAGVKLLFTRLGRYILATLAICGFAVFCVTETHTVYVLQTIKDSWFIYLSMIPLTLVTASLHELGHAFGTKYYGREVHSMGVGWNWIAPMAFTDTTDMWLDTRARRIAVNAAGLYANILVAGICSLLILVVDSYYAQAFLWLFALTTYVKGFAMLNPSQDFDGYFIMMDLFEKQHLRLDATAWLIKKFPQCLCHPSLFKRYWHEVGYWLACLAFLAITALITFYVQGFIFKLLKLQPPNLLLTMIIPLLTVVLSSLSLIADIRDIQD